MTDVAKIATAGLARLAMTPCRIKHAPINRSSRGDLCKTSFLEVQSRIHFPFFETKRMLTKKAPVNIPPHGYPLEFAFRPTKFRIEKFFLQMENFFLFFYQIF